MCIARAFHLLGCANLCWDRVHFHRSKVRSPEGAPISSEILMAVLEVETFTLTAGVDAVAFRALDEQMQEWCYVNRPGLARRTTARAEDGTYVVITLFGDASQAVSTYYKNTDAVVVAWSAAITESSRSIAVYSLL